MRIVLPRIVKDFSKPFSENGFQCFLVGGAVRNLVSGSEPKDFDFATDALPEQVVRLFRKVIPTGIKHGTVTVLYKNYKFEVTTFRVDGKYSNTRHPDNVLYTPSILEDLERRDFTINAIACNIVTGEVLDPQMGISDLNARIIKAIGNPYARFSEDGLRLLRACRFTAQLNFSLEEETKKAMFDCRMGITSISAERVRDEITKSLLSDTPSRAFNAMFETGLLDLILPELYETVGHPQDGPPGFDLFKHLLLSCNGAPKNNIPVRLAALFHDLGKPETFSKSSEGLITYHGHENISAEKALKILIRLKFPGPVIKKTIHLIKHHMIGFSPEWTDAAVRRLITRVGLNNISDLHALLWADRFGKTGSMSFSDPFSELFERINRLSNTDAVFSLKDLAVDGNILQKEASIPPGPLLGVILNQLLETVLDDPDQNSKDILLPIAKNIYSALSAGK